VTAMTFEEFTQAVSAARETILMFLSNMPPNATVAEVLRAINAESMDDPEFEMAYRQFIALDISATQSKH